MNPDDTSDYGGGGLEDRGEGRKKEGRDENGDILNIVHTYLKVTY